MEKKIWFGDQDLGFILEKNMKFDLKWVHMARYELILRQDGAIWLMIILKPLLAPKGAIQDPKIKYRNYNNTKMIPKQEPV